MSLYQTARAVGVRHLLKQARAYQLAWPGILSGFFTTRIMQTLFNVGFFDELRVQGTIEPGAFAKKNDLDDHILKSLCDSLYSLRILRKQGADYSLDSRGKVLVDVARGWFDGVYGYEDILHSLEDLLTGRKVYGEDVSRRNEFIVKGCGEAEALLCFPLAIDLIANNGFGVVLDLGCGDGEFLKQIGQRHPRLRGYGVDRCPHAIEVAKAEVRRLGIEDRIDFVLGDITRIHEMRGSLPGVDVVTAFFLFHELLSGGETPVVELLRNLGNTFPRATLMVWETIRPSPQSLRRRPGMGIQYFLHHDLTCQKPVGREQWRDLFEKAGYPSIEERYLAFARISIFTIKPEAVVI